MPIRKVERRSNATRQSDDAVHEPESSIAEGDLSVLSLQDIRMLEFNEFLNNSRPTETK